MKFQKIIAALALPLMALFSSCEQDPEMMPKISTDKPVYEVGAEGGDVVVKLLATQDWNATVSPATSLDKVDDIKVEPNSGSATSQIVEVTVKVPENKEYDRKATISFVGATVSGAVTVAQKGDKGAEILTCTVAEFLEKPVDASVYYVLEGEVTNSAATRETYSNFTLLDPESGASVLIYGLAYKEDVSNQKVGLLAKEGINDGDWIKIASTRGEYNGTIEGLNSYYIEHKKSENPSIKLGLDEVTAAKGSTFELAVTSNIVTWTLSSNVSWLSFEPATSDKSETVVVTVAEDGEGDEGVITLAAEGLESVTCKVTRTDIMDITIADFLAAEVSDKLYRITAKIESIVKEDYGNIYVQDATGRIYVYGLTATPVAKNDKSFASLGLRAGDIITFVGKRGHYESASVEDQKEQVSGAYFEKSYKSADVTITEFLTKEVASKYLESPYYRLTGVVKEIVKEEYGNLYLKEADSDTYVYVYGVTKAPVAKNDKSFAELGVKAGDKLTIVGQRGQYSSAKVEDQKEQVANAYFISVEAGDSPIPPVEDDLTVENASIEVEADAVSTTFSVKSNLDWTVTKTEGDWITSYTESGSGNGTIKVVFPANTAAELRAAKFTVASGELSAEFTLQQKGVEETVYTTLAEVNEAILAAGKDGLDFKVNLSSAEVTKICYDSKTSYIQDATGAIMIYGAPLTTYIKDAAEKTTISGIVTGTGTVYYGLPEVTSIDFTEATVAQDGKGICTEATIAEVLADFNKYLNCKVKLTDASVKDAFSKSDKNGVLAQGESELAIYVKNTSEDFAFAAGTVVDGYVYPALYNTTKQAYFWGKEDFTVKTVGAEIALKSSYNVNVGETVELGATCTSGAALKYVSSDETIATVSEAGVVSGVKEGTVTVTVSAEAVAGYTAATATTTITVNPTGSVTPEVLIIDGSQLTSEYTTEEVTKTYSGVEIVFGKDVKQQAIQSGAVNCISDEGAILVKSGSYVYNKVAIPGKITKFEIYANKGASGAVEVGVNFSAEPITEYSSSATNTYEAKLSTLDSVYDCSEKLPTDAKYFYYKVTNSKNSQVQFRITYVAE